jgi:hypothetical protein
LVEHGAEEVLLVVDEGFAVVASGFETIRLANREQNFLVVAVAGQGHISWGVGGSMRHC